MCTRKSQVYPTLLFSNPPPLALNSFPAPSCGDAQASAKEAKSDDRPVFLSLDPGKKNGRVRCRSLAMGLDNSQKAIGGEINWRRG